ncbi:hypothetical protein FHY25_000266 [Xanthomonas arboricola]|uniref:hypothetical protein n=1 Tax=Xanthomonas campestris TaxID=339 RepID=UPI0023E96A39|nr:hypothetical protein [Xanthomonas campestris]MCW2005685.1 hypothetical protein [Xanthomonas campestris]
MTNISGVGHAATTAAEALLHAAQWPRITDTAGSNAARSVLTAKAKSSCAVATRTKPIDRARDAASVQSNILTQASSVKTSATPAPLRDLQAEQPQLSKLRCD